MELVDYDTLLVAHHCCNQSCALKLSRRPFVSRNWLMYLGDIQQSCERILRYTAGMSQEDLVADGGT